MIIYGKKMSMFAAALIIINLLGVVIAYIVLVWLTLDRSKASFLRQSTACQRARPLNL